MTGTHQPWGNEIVYHLFVDRFRNGDRSLDVREGEFEFRAEPVSSSGDRRLLVGDRTHQKTFYNGDLKGIRDSLSYMQELGITALLLTPIFQSHSTHRYDTDDYMRLDPHVGTDADFQGLLDDLHARGMKLVLDGVFGHTSLEHPWYRDPELRRRRYRLKPDGTAETWLNWGVMPKLDTDDPDTQDQLLAVIDRWKGVDGWRLDASQHLSASFLRRLKARLREHNPEAIVIGEEWEPVASQLHDGLYDGVLNFQFRRPLIDFFRAEIATETFVRRLSVYIDSYPAHSVRHCWNLLDNHDTERFYGVHAKDLRRLRLAIALQMFLPGTPQLYYGDEVGMQARNAHGSRAPMLWEPRRWDRSIQDTYRSLIATRRAHPVFAEGSCEWVHASNRHHAMAFVRRSPDEEVLVALNAGEFPCSLTHQGRTIELAPQEFQVIFA